MMVINTVQDYRNWKSKNDADFLGFVPTMGNLHDGHAALAKKSVKENKSTVVSIFVNPTQFNNANDFENYPKTLEQDVKLLKSLGVDVLFTPSAKEMYPNGFAHKISRNSETRILCDAFRPGHFDGVLTVVAKLFNIVQPSRAYFGEKDYQQLQYIKEMASDLFVPVEIVPCPTVREKTGLAMSSRNNRLSEDAKQKAALVYDLISKSEHINAKQLSDILKARGMELEYCEDHWGRRFVAFWVEGVRLIDNVAVCSADQRTKESV